MNEETDQELPEVNGVHIIKVNNDGSEDIKSFMEDWLEENAEISTDPCEIVIFLHMIWIMFWTEMKKTINICSLQDSCKERNGQLYKMLTI